MMKEVKYLECSCGTKNDIDAKFCKECGVGKNVEISSISFPEGVRDIKLDDLVHRPFEFTWDEVAVCNNCKNTLDKCTCVFTGNNRLDIRYGFPEDKFK